MLGSPTRQFPAHFLILSTLCLSGVSIQAIAAPGKKPAKSINPPESNTAEQAAGDVQTGLHFIDLTDQAGLTSVNAFYPTQSYAFMISGGVAADFNNDGYDDILHLGAANPNSLFINNRDGTFTDHAEEWGIQGPFHSYSASTADFNKDGYIDIFITAFGPADAPPVAGKFMLMKNNGPDEQGNWSFTDVAQSAGVNRLLPTSTLKEGAGSSWGDYDLDGDLDLFICSHYAQFAGNRLFRNDGPDSQGVWRFTDATIEAGLQTTGVAGFFPSFIDLNNDRYPELVVIADYGTSRYYINNHDGTFTNATNMARGLETANGMGIDIADINHDQRLDFFVSNIRYNNPPVGGNVLLIQNPDGTFDDRAPAADCHEGYWGWGSLINDFDHDGDKDILETNGYNGFSNRPVTLYLNDGVTNDPQDLRFTESAAACGINHRGQGRGLIRLDVENDGDMDAVIFNHMEPTAYYRNEIINPDTTNPDTHWVRLKLDTSARLGLAPQGIGAMITVITPEQEYILPIHSNPTYCGSSPVDTHLGLADQASIMAVRVAWADGSFTTWTDVQADTIRTLSASSHPADLDNSGSVGMSDIARFLDTYLNDNLSADLNGDSELDFLDISRFISDYRDATMTP